MTYRCTYIHGNRACFHICWHMEQINCKAAVIGGCETHSADSSHFLLRVLGSAPGSWSGGGGGMSVCDVHREERVLLLRSCVLGTERKAMFCPTLCRMWDVKGTRVGRPQLDQNYQPGRPVSLLESPCCLGLPA